MPQTIQISVSCPHDLYEIVKLLSEETGRSQSAIAVMLMEKGYPIVFEELNKVETYKNFRDKRRAKKNGDSTKANEAEDDSEQKVKDKSGDSKSKK